MLPALILTDGEASHCASQQSRRAQRWHDSVIIVHVSHPACLSASRVRACLPAGFAPRSSGCCPCGVVRLGCVLDSPTSPGCCSPFLIQLLGNRCSPSQWRSSLSERRACVSNGLSERCLSAVTQRQTDAPPRVDQSLSVLFAQCALRRPNDGCDSALYREKLSDWLRLNL